MNPAQEVHVDMFIPIALWPKGPEVGGLRREGTHGRLSAGKRAWRLSAGRVGHVILFSADGVCFIFFF